MTRRRALALPTAIAGNTSAVAATAAAFCMAAMLAVWPGPADAQAPAEDSAAMQGKVTDAATGLPLTGVDIVLSVAGTPQHAAARRHQQCRRQLRDHRRDARHVCSRGDVRRLPGLRNDRDRRRGRQTRILEIEMQPAKM